MTITYPYKSGLYVNLTNRCPCACVFCLRQNGPSVNGTDSLWLEREPTSEEVKASIDSRNLEDFSELVFCGYGEPTERLDVLLEATRHAKGRKPGLKVRVNTNGLSDLIHGEPTAQCFEGLVDMVSISLNAPDPEEYLKLCRPTFGLKSWQAMVDFATSCAGGAGEMPGAHGQDRRAPAHPPVRGPWRRRFRQARGVSGNSRLNLRPDMVQYARF